MPRPPSSEPPRRYFKELRFRQFRAFREVARSLSFASAADVLQISRPSVWQQVRALEEELGTELLRTESQQLSLTEDGSMLLEMITPLVESFDSLKAVFLDRRRDVVRRLTVATTSTVLANDLLEPVRLYRQRHPDVRFSFIERPSREALPLLESGQADLAFVGILEEAPRPVTLEFDEWLRFPFVLICPPEHPLASARRVQLKDLVGHPLLLPAEATNARTRIEDVLRKAGLFKKANIVLESSTSLVLGRYAEMGLGVALTSLSPMLIEELRSGSLGHTPLVVRELTNLFGEEPVVLAHRKGRHLLNHINEFRQLALAARAKSMPAS